MRYGFYFIINISELHLSLNKIDDIHEINPFINPLIADLPICLALNIET
jgi:hypothetical protein